MGWVPAGQGASVPRQSRYAHAVPLLTRAKRGTFERTQCLTVATELGDSRLHSSSSFISINLKL